ncbi:MAG: YkgJ family cysteine cluster protein [Burkholderiales bacterium]|nr:YkgJ family cysteine cluster protein [Burkholderiales bacterium]MDE2396115.1 YkgJ family cysteine cluster protein [Burkholderiales bacterium]MDE2457456.1 YkgJ family cysteine cluster protein [Burkholderiales bacterium]
MATIQFTIRAKGLELEASAKVPTGATRVGELLPLARSLADAVVRQTCDAAAAAGEPVSCRAGCGACCSHLVAVSEIEARRIGEVVDGLAEPRRSEVLARFERARERLAEAGLLDELERPQDWTGERYHRLTGAYFRLSLPCPFLEQGSCSIYEERPLTCREYHVVSDPAHCALPGHPGVRVVRPPLRFFNAVARWQTPATEHLEESAVALIVAPAWARSHPDATTPRPGVELLRELLDHLNEDWPAA